MPATRRESSADSAARFLANRSRKPPPYRRVVERVPPNRPMRAACCGFRRQARNLISRDGAFVCVPGKGCGHGWAPLGPRRIVCDFAEPTLRAIHKALCDAMAPREHRPEHYTGELLNLIVIAEQMVGRALGYPDCDDPPLTDREVR